jgi:DNA-binding transcriptional regulator YdaS (Cro superfamily)
MDHTGKQALLEQAVRLLGRTSVATRLGVSDTLLEAWMRGETPMPTRNLLILAAMLEERAKGAGRRRQTL